MSDKKHLQWLHAQIPHWVNAKLIDQDQALAIENNSQKRLGVDLSHHSESDMGRVVFSSIGAILFSLGVILFFAYNWQDMHRFLKLAIIFSAIFFAHAGAQWFSRPSNTHPTKNRAASEGLALLGTMLFGAGIWLVSQIYHINEHYPNAFMAWGIGALLMAWVRLSLIQAILSLVLLSVWGYLETVKFHSINHLSPWIIMIGLAPLAWILRSSLLLFFSLVLFYSLWMASLIDPLDETLFYVILTVAAILIGVGILFSRANIDHFPKLRYVLIFPGYTVYLCYVYGLTFAHFSKKQEVLTAFENNFQAAFFWAPLCIAIVTAVSACLPLKKLQPAEETDKLQITLLLFSLCLIYTVGSGFWSLSYPFLSGLMNLVFIGHCLLFIIHGSRDQRAWEVALGCLLFSSLVFARYIDLFDSLLSRSLIFLILGASLFLVGNFYSRHKFSKNSRDGSLEL